MVGSVTFWVRSLNKTSCKYSCYSSISDPHLVSASFYHHMKLHCMSKYIISLKKIAPIYLEFWTLLAYSLPWGKDNFGTPLLIEQCPLPVSRVFPNFRIVFGPVLLKFFEFYSKSDSSTLWDMFLEYKTCLSSPIKLLGMMIHAYNIKNTSSLLHSQLTHLYQTQMIYTSDFWYSQSYHYTHQVSDGSHLFFYSLHTFSNIAPQ